MIVGLDIGTSKVTCVAGEVERGGRDARARLLGVGIAPSQGVKKGQIVDAARATAAVTAAVEAARLMAGRPFRACYVSLAGTHLTATNSRGVATVMGAEQLVEEGDVDRVLESARSAGLLNTQKIVQLLPRGFRLDGIGVTNPIGLYGYRLEADAHLIAASASALQTIEDCVWQSGLEVAGFVPASLAAGEAVLAPDERELGVALIDVGAGTSDLVLYRDGAVWHTASLPVGGHHFTADLATALQCSRSVAEALKLRDGGIGQEALADERPLSKPAGGAEAWRRCDLAAVLHARALDVFDLVAQEIRHAGAGALLPAGVVFCGGTAQMDGWCEAAAAALQLPVRVAGPRTLAGEMEMVSGPAHSAPLGLLHWGARRAPSANGRRPQPAASLSWRDLSQRATHFWQRLQPFVATLLPDPQDS